jgi:transposase InsO family protein
VGAATQPQRRGPAKQQAQRTLEQQARHDAVAFGQWLKARGGTCAEAAQLLNRSARTLRDWDYDSWLAPREVAPLGRPPHRAPVEERRLVLDCLKAQGAYRGVPTLHTQFPRLGRNELADLLHRYRRLVRDRYRDTVSVLHWQPPGRVWAVDFAEPSLVGAASVLPPVDGLYPYLLAVRDLASGYQLAWLPVSAPTAAVTEAVLERLFALHGAPLVLKSDNSAAFRANATKQFLENAGFFSLFSPPHCPGYNGALEATIGSLKTRTQEHAAREGRPGMWTMADVEVALRAANAARPRRLQGQTPADVWAART